MLPSQSWVIVSWEASSAIMGFGSACILVRVIGLMGKPSGRASKSRVVAKKPRWKVTLAVPRSLSFDVGYCMRRSPNNKYTVYNEPTVMYDRA